MLKREKASENMRVRWWEAMTVCLGDYAARHHAMTGLQHRDSKPNGISGHEIRGMRLGYEIRGMRLGT